MVERTRSVLYVARILSCFPLLLSRLSGLRLLEFWGFSTFRPRSVCYLQWVFSQYATITMSL